MGEKTKILITKTEYDGAADATFDQTYLFDKSHAKIIHEETLPLIDDFLFFTLGRKNTVTRRLWLTRNGGFVLESCSTNDRPRYNILDKSEAERYVIERSEEIYIQTFHPQEI